MMLPDITVHAINSAYKSRLTFPANTEGRRTMKFADMIAEKLYRKKNFKDLTVNWGSEKAQAFPLPMIPKIFTAAAILKTIGMATINPTKAAGEPEENSAAPAGTITIIAIGTLIFPLRHNTLPTSLFMLTILFDAFLVTTVYGMVKFKTYKPSLKVDKARIKTKTIETIIKNMLLIMLEEESSIIKSNPKKL